jgi:ATP-dependent DNA helicase RecG
MLRLDAPLQYVKGVGPRKADGLREKGFETVADLLWLLPHRYEDRGNPGPLRAAREGEEITARARIVHSRLLHTRRRGFSILQLLIDDGSGSIRATLFNRAWLLDKLTAGREGFWHGRVSRDRIGGGIVLENPAFELIQPGDETEWTRIVPIHPRLPGFTARQQRALVRRVLDDLDPQAPDTLPEGLGARLALPAWDAALRDVHFPPASANLDEYQRRASPAHGRLIFEELFGMQAAFLLRRQQAGRRPERRRYETRPETGDALRALLPFRLTAGQRQAFRDIVEDLRKPEPMARLLQGDVGSGKTIVALLAMLLAVENGFQAALMAPTELLAEQHARSFQRLLEGRRQIAYLSGSLGAKERRQVLALVESGDVSLVIGTHALIQDAVHFRDLALVVIDEQHRFGVEQRAQLAAKGEAPDVLVMSATPIPRTLALALHGDLDVSNILDRPPGRRPVRTVLRDEDARERVVAFLESQVALGRQAYVVHPVIDESADDDLHAAIEGAEHLMEVLPGRRVGLVHGRMKAADREAVMRSFAAGSVDVLVATTVIEVGIDVPNATVMVIEAAERYGLSQLHQLRGRVGRGAHASWCILMRGAQVTPQGEERLELLRSTEDGFALAEADLRLRGAGETFGARQAGMRDLRVADPLRDQEVLQVARREAQSWLARLDEVARARDPLLRVIASRWNVAAERSAVG